MLAVGLATVVFGVLYFRSSARPRDGPFRFSAVSSSSDLLPPLSGSDDLISDLDSVSSIASSDSGTRFDPPTIPKRTAASRQADPALAAQTDTLL